MGDNAIQQYYGEILTSQRDLKTGACCSPEAMPPYLREWLRLADPRGGTRAMLLRTTRCA